MSGEDPGRSGAGSTGSEGGGAGQEASGLLQPTETPTASTTTATVAVAAAAAAALPDGQMSPGLVAAEGGAGQEKTKPTHMDPDERERMLAALLPLVIPGTNYKVRPEDLERVATSFQRHKNCVRNLLIRARDNNNNVKSRKKGNVGRKKIDRRAELDQLLLELQQLEPRNTQLQETARLAEAAQQRAEAAQQRAQEAQQLQQQAQLRAQELKQISKEAKQTHKSCVEESNGLIVALRNQIRKLRQPRTDSESMNIDPENERPLEETSQSQMVLGSDQGQGLSRKRHVEEEEERRRSLRQRTTMIGNRASVGVADRAPAGAPGGVTGVADSAPRVVGGTDNHNDTAAASSTSTSYDDTAAASLTSTSAAAFTPDQVNGVERQQLQQQREQQQGADAQEDVHVCGSVDQLGEGQDEDVTDSDNLATDFDATPDVHTPHAAVDQGHNEKAGSEPGATYGLNPPVQGALPPSEDQQPLSVNDDAATGSPTDSSSSQGPNASAITNNNATSITGHDSNGKRAVGVDHSDQNNDQTVNQTNAAATASSCDKNTKQQLRRSTRLACQVADRDSTSTGTAASTSSRGNQAPRSSSSRRGKKEDSNPFVDEKIQALLEKPAAKQLTKQFFAPTDEEGIGIRNHFTDKLMEFYGNWRRSKRGGVVANGTYATNENKFSNDHKFNKIKLCCRSVAEMFDRVWMTTGRKTRFVEKNGLRCLDNMRVLGHAEHSGEFYVPTDDDGLDYITTSREEVIAEMENTGLCFDKVWEYHEEKNVFKVFKPLGVVEDTALSEEYKSDPFSLLFGACEVHFGLWPDNPSDRFPAGFFAPHFDKIGQVVVFEPVTPCPSYNIVAVEDHERGEVMEDRQWPELFDKLEDGNKYNGVEDREDQADAFRNWCEKVKKTRFGKDFNQCLNTFFKRLLDKRHTKKNGKSKPIKVLVYRLDQFDKLILPAGSFCHGTIVPDPTFDIENQQFVGDPIPRVLLIHHQLAVYS